MGPSRSGRARRIEPAVTFDAGEGRAPDYATSFAADFPDAAAQSAEQWARTILEGAPLLLRWFVFVGWKFVLRLRLAPQGTAGTVAGWTISTSPRDELVLEVTSSLVTAHKVLHVESSRLILTTYVWYEATRGRVLWSAIAPVHHLIEPLLMTMAASRVRDERANEHR